MGKRKPKYFPRALFRPSSIDELLGLDVDPKTANPALGYAQVWHKANIDPYTIVNEFIAGEIGRFLRLPITPFAITYYDDNGLKPLFSSMDFNFNRQRLPSVHPQPCVKHLPSVSAGVTVFDILIANDDRTDENLVVDRVRQPKEMQVFDHAECLLAGYGESGISRLTTERDEIGAVKKMHSGQERPHLLMPFLTTSKDLHGWITRVDSLPDWFVAEICRNAIELGLTKDEAKEVNEFVVHRRNTLRNIIDRNKHRFPLVTDWEGGLI